MTSPRVTPVAYRDGYKYQLAANYHVQTTLRPPAPIVTAWITLDRDGLLTILAGYAWDGASGPTLDGKSAVMPSLIHDVLYQLIGLGFLDARTVKPYADDLFGRLLEQCGMPWWRRGPWHAAVKWFGPRGGSVPKPVKFAP